MRRDDFPSAIAPGDDRKGEAPPDEIGQIPFDIQIGPIPAVAAMLRPDSSPIHNCPRAQSLSSGIRPPLTLDLQSMEHTGEAASYFPAQNSCFREMAYGGAKGKSPPGGAGRAGAAKIAGWRL